MEMERVAQTAHAAAHGTITFIPNLPYAIAFACPYVSPGGAVPVALASPYPAALPRAPDSASTARPEVVGSDRDDEDDDDDFDPEDFFAGEQHAPPGTDNGDDSMSDDDGDGESPPRAGDGNHGSTPRGNAQGRTRADGFTPTVIYGARILLRVPAQHILIGIRIVIPNVPRNLPMVLWRGET